MTISGKIKKKKAVILSPERINLLCDIILKHCERLEFTAETYAQTRISFDSLEELLAYDNFKPRRIVKLEVDGYNGYSRSISVEISDLNTSLIANYGSTIRCDYKFCSIDQETVFKSDFEIWYEKVVADYWFLGKFSFTGLLFVPSAFITLIRLVAGHRMELDLSNGIILGSIIFVTLATFAIFYIIKWLDTNILGNLFPAVSFLWGEEEKRNKKWEKFRSNLLWGVVIAILVGVVTSYLYDTLIGL